MKTLSWLKKVAVLSAMFSLLNVGILYADAATTEDNAAIEEALSHVLLDDSLFEEGKQPVMAVWITYALSRLAWIRKNAPEVTEEPTYHVSFFEEELSGRESLIKAWGELQDKDPSLKDPYLDELLIVYKNGYLKEYVWYYLWEEDWGEPSEEVRMEEFIDWQDANLPGHQAETLAGLTFETE